jgi:predicted nucleotidyltransferase component of viral defense system
VIPRAHIEEWRATAAWPMDAQVEQDLIICRALVAIFSDPILNDRLAFRGGTALHKLYIMPQTRYSEDIDLVQKNAEPIREILDRLRAALAFLGEPTVQQTAMSNKLLFRFASEVPPVARMRLKVEINCREHFSVLGYAAMPYAVRSNWFDGECTLVTYPLEELLGTKLRALYQRSKGRDLYDLHRAITIARPDCGKIMHCYREYMKASVTTPPSRREYSQNLDEKMRDPDFLNDLEMLLKPGEEYDPVEAYRAVTAVLIEKI